MLLSQFYFWLLKRFYEPEAARNLVIQSLRNGGGPTIRPAPHRATKLFGKDIPSDILMSAGFDKYAEAIPGILKMGFGGVEVGSVSINPREGNPQPRHWRFGNDAAFNWYGLNSNGLTAFAHNLHQFRKDYGWEPLVGVSLVNPGSDDYENFTHMAVTLGVNADYFTLNHSCPNTQETDSDETLRAQIRAIRKGTNKPLLVKFGPTINVEVLLRTAAICMEEGVAGFVVTNTMPYAEASNHPDLFTPEDLANWPRDNAEEPKPVGGYSGPKLLSIAAFMTSSLRGAYPDAVILSGGGVQSRADADFLRSSGADAVCILTGLAVKGPALMRELVA